MNKEKDMKNVKHGKIKIINDVLLNILILLNVLINFKVDGTENFLILNTTLIIISLVLIAVSTLKLVKYFNDSKKGIVEYVKDDIIQYVFLIIIPILLLIQITLLLR